MILFTASMFLVTELFIEMLSGRGASLYGCQGVLEYNTESFEEASCLHEECVTLTEIETTLELSKFHRFEPTAAWTEGNQLKN